MVDMSHWRMSNILKLPLDKIAMKNLVYYIIVLMMVTSCGGTATKKSDHVHEAGHDHGDHSGNYLGSHIHADGAVDALQLIQLLSDKDKIDIKVNFGDSAAFLVTASREERSIYEGQLSSSDTCRFEHYELAIPRLRRWCYIDVVESPYLNLVFAGFWVGLAGLSVSFIPRVLSRRRRAES